MDLLTFPPADARPDAAGLLSALWLGSMPGTTGEGVVSAGLRERLEASVDTAPFTPEQLEDRVMVLWGIQECQRCGRAADCGAADDPRWFVDSYVGERDDVGEPIIYGTVLCPACW